jgi:hypothetical protein
MTLLEAYKQRGVALKPEMAPEAFISGVLSVGSVVSVAPWLATAAATVQKLLSVYNTLVDSLGTAEKTVETASAALESAQDAYDKYLANPSSIPYIANITTGMCTPQATTFAAYTALSEARTALEQAKEEVSNLQEQTTTAYNSLITQTQDYVKQTMKTVI